MRIDNLSGEPENMGIGVTAVTAAIGILSKIGKKIPRKWLTIPRKLRKKMGIKDKPSEKIKVPNISMSTGKPVTTEKPFPIIPIAIGGAAIVGFLLMRKKR